MITSRWRSRWRTGRRWPIGWRCPPSARTLPMNGAGGASAGVHILVIMRERTPMTACAWRGCRSRSCWITSGMRNALSIGRRRRARRRGARHQQRVGGADGADPALLLGLAKHIVPESVGLQKQRSVAAGSSASPCRGKRWGCWGWARSAARWPGGAGVRHAGAGSSQNRRRNGRRRREALLAPSKRALFEQSDFVSIHRC